MVLQASQPGQTGDFTYTPASPVDESFTVSQAIPSITLTPYDVTYDGIAQTATGTAIGVGGVDLSNDLNLTGTTHTNAGTYTDTWIFADPTGNYAPESGTITDVINQATPVINVVPYYDVYDGTAQAATGTAIGADGVNLSADLNLAGTMHTNAGTYTDTWTFTDPTGNYVPVTGTVTDVVTQAPLIISAVPDSKVYDGTTTSTQVPTVSGLQGTDTVTDLAQAFNSPDVQQATTVAVTSYSVNDDNGGNNYEVITETASGTIAPAAIAVSVIPYDVTYDGIAQTATGTAIGVGGVDLSNDLNLTGTTHTNAGTYTDTWTFADPAGNYAPESGTITDVITPATASIVVSGYTGTYDGQAHGANLVSATGVDGIALPGSDVTLGASFTSVPGGVADWVFSDPNYVSQTGNVAIVINPASISYIIGNGSQVQGTPVNLANVLPGTINTGINGETLDIAYTSTGDTASASAGTYPINGTVSDGTGSLENYVVSLTPGVLTVTPLQPSMLNQTINFAAISSVTYGAANFTVSATATSGLPVTFSVMSGPATISGDTVHITGAGVVTIAANQAGNATYNPAPTVDQSFTVNKAAPTLLGLAIVNVEDTSIISEVVIGVCGGKIPTGTVTFYLGSEDLGTANILDGVAIFVTGKISSGKITADYSGDTNHLSASSPVLEIGLMILPVNRENHQFLRGGYPRLYRKLHLGNKPIA